MSLGKNWFLLRPLFNKAGVGVLVCALSCAFIGCGSKESTSENQKKPESSSSVNPAPQSVQPEGKNAQRGDLKFPSNLSEKEAAGDIVVPPWPGAQGEVDTSSVELLPTFPGKPPLSQQEIDALKKSAAMEGVDLNTMEVIPPNKPGERGITLGEVKARAAELASGLTDLDVIEVVPPREPGGRGLTQGELKAMGSLSGPDTPPPDFPPETAIPAEK